MKSQWPGYRPFTRQKYARRVKGLQNRAKIAKQVAEVVGEFINVRAASGTVTLGTMVADTRLQ